MTNKLPQELIDLLDRHFPKGKCAERGEALVMLAFFWKWYREKTMQGLLDQVEEIKGN